MRKLFLIPVALFLAAVPAAFAATGGRAVPVERPGDSAEKTAAPDVGEARAATRAANHAVDRRVQEKRRKRRRAEAAKAQAAPQPQAAVPPQLEAIAACESGGDPSAVSSNGMYRGKYQFSTATWQATGGLGDPAAAPEAEQDKRAAMLYARSGAGQWPVCGQ